MDFNVHDSSGMLIGIVENPTSAIWTRRFQAPDDFELYFPASSDLLALIADDCFITREDADEVMLVEHVELITDEENGNCIRIAGRGAEALLDRRIILEQTTLSGRVDNAIRRLIYENAAAPSDTDRKLPIAIDTTAIMADTISAQYTGTNLLEAVEEICKAYGLGFRAVVDNYAQVTPTIQLMKGTDRSEAQAERSPVIFSPEFENLLSSSYVLDTTKFKNVAIVAGEGEGKTRKRATYGSASGMARRELFVDARDMSTNEGEISASDYTAQMLARGAEKIAECGITEAFDGEITVSNFTIGVDYFLGDIVTVENEYGIRKHNRITSIMESEDETGRKSVPIFENVEV